MNDDNITVVINRQCSDILSCNLGYTASEPHSKKRCIFFLINLNLVRAFSRTIPVCALRNGGNSVARRKGRKWGKQNKILPQRVTASVLIQPWQLNMPGGIPGETFPRELPSSGSTRTHSNKPQDNSECQEVSHGRDAQPLSSPCPAPVLSQGACSPAIICMPLWSHDSLHCPCSILSNFYPLTDLTNWPARA